MSPRPRLVVLWVIFSTACGLDVVGVGTAAREGDAGVGAGSSSSGGLDGGSKDEADATASSPLGGPSHVDAAFDPGAPDLSGIVGIDTTARTVTLSSGAAPTGLRFESIGGRAVLFVRKLIVDVDLGIKGSAPLVVLASGDIVVSAKVHARATRVTPGPGGSPPGAGKGGGASAVPNLTDDPGGGGGGFGTLGAAGGDGSSLTVVGAAGGATYGERLADFLGGSGGGNGSPFGVLPCAGDGSGGAGGGALQLTSGTRVDLSPSGAINVGGGGGRGGCINGDVSTMSGGGGGSGGTIFLEAPSVRIAGTLASNGGGGGGGAQVSTGIRGEDGEDGAASLAPAAGGAGSAGRVGGAGGVRGAAPVKPTGNFNNHGGGGGAVGRIWLRTRTVPATVESTATVSPAPDTDTTF